MNASKKRSLMMGMSVIAVCALALIAVPAFATTTGGDGKYYVCHVTADHTYPYAHYQYLEVGGLSGHFYGSNPSLPKHGEWSLAGGHWLKIYDFVTVQGDEDCDGEPDDIPGCMDPEAWNYNPEATVDDQSCVYDVCPNLEGLQEEVPEGYIKPGRRCIPKPKPHPVCEDEGAYNFGEPLPCTYDVCPNLEGLQEEVPEGYIKPGQRCIPKPEPLHDYWLKVWYEVDCTGVEYYFAVMDFQTMKLGPFSLKTHSWTDPFTLEVAPAVTHISYNPGEPYGTLSADDVPAINEPERCYQEPEEDYAIDVDCEGWEVIYIPNVEIKAGTVVASGKWKDKHTLEAVKVFIEQLEITVDVLEPRECYQCEQKSLFYWTDGFCSIRQREGPIGGQTRPFVPMIYGFCGCDYVWGDWTGIWIRTCAGNESAEYEYWDELPKGCGWRNCGGLAQ